MYKRVIKARCGCLTKKKVRQSHLYTIKSSVFCNFKKCFDGDVVVHEVRERLEDNGARLTTWVYDTQNTFTSVAKLTGIGKLSDLQSIPQNVYTITSNHLGTPTSGNVAKPHEV